MTLLELKHILADRINQLSVHQWNRAHTEVTTRCPYCGDSKNILHGHFSIRINTNDDSICLYRCFKCSEAGILNSQVMEDLGVYLSIDDIKSIDVLNRPNSKSTYSRQRPLKYKVPVVINHVDNKLKLDYLKSRLGLEFTDEMIQEYKIVLSIYDFFMENKIKFPEHINPKMIKLIEENYIGFLSANNNKLVFRNITNNDKLSRYIKISIDPYNTSPNNFFSLVNPQINILYTNPIHIHVAEGTFDIVSIKYNLYHDPSETHLFFAACGYNFNTILKWLIYMGVNTDVILHLYSDNDKSDYENMKVINNALNKCWIDKAFIHRNTFENEKDFGVPKERIRERKLFM